jgi:hypothetical protein
LLHCDIFDDNTLALSDKRCRAIEEFTKDEEFTRARLKPADVEQTCDDDGARFDGSNPSNRNENATARWNLDYQSEDSGGNLSALEGRDSIAHLSDLVTGWVKDRSACQARYKDSIQCSAHSSKGTG